MIKTYVKRSQYQFVTVNSGSRTDVLIEGDEAYIVSLDSANPITIRRAKELELFKVGNGIHSYITNNSNACFEVVLTSANGRVSLGGQPIATVLTAGSNDFPTNVGIKETISLGIATGTMGVTQKVLIETVHYVPADTIAA